MREWHHYLVMQLHAYLHAVAHQSPDTSTYTYTQTGTHKYTHKYISTSTQTHTHVHTSCTKILTLKIFRLYSKLFSAPHTTVTNKTTKSMSNLTDDLQSVVSCDGEVCLVVVCNMEVAFFKSGHKYSSVVLVN